MAPQHDNPVPVPLPLPPEIAALRDEFPDGWSFGTIWCSAGSGPDPRRYYAGKGAILLTAWSHHELARLIRDEEERWPGQ